MTARPMTLADVLEGMADALPDRIAIATIDRDYTYAEIDERSNRLARYLLDQGLQAGDHVAVHSHNRIEWIDAFYGCFKARLVPININYRYKHDELQHLYTNSDAKFTIIGPEYVELIEDLDTPMLKGKLVMGDEYAAAVAAVSPERLPNERTSDDHYVIYTGGTTGYPKGVVWRQEDLMRGALNASRYGAPMESIEQLVEEAKANENPFVLLACGPMMHGGSQWILGNGHVSGSTVSIFTEKHFDPAKILDLVQKAGVLSLTVLGDAMGRPLAEAILAEPDRWDLSKLAAISSGAAPLSLSVREQLREALPGKFILDTYGASESGAAGMKIDEGSDDGSARFNVNDDVEVFDVNMQPCEVGVQGFLARKGSIPLGYYNDPQKTEATFPVVDGVRWVIPGDMARREEDGSITVLGRGSVCINTGGEKVFPEEVEAVLLRHPEVFDAAVAGTPHERWGSMVTALVHRREGSELSEAELIAFAKEIISDYKVPKRIFFVDAVPRTPVSKVDYPAVAAQAKELVSE